MLITCPNCKKRFDVAEASVHNSPKFRCSCCRAVFRLVRKGAGSDAPEGPAAPPVSTSQTSQTEPTAPAPPCASPAVPAAPAAAAAPVAPGTIKVVVANESVPFCEAVRKVLASEPFQLFICHDGKEALETVEQVQPNLLLLDVALPTMFGFEVCERVRHNPALAGVKIVLIASIYDKTRYKRSPNSLYGADDYIEKHHIPDSLVPMIYRLVSGSAPEPVTPSRDELAQQLQSRSEIREAEVAEMIPPPDRVELSEPEIKARRLARIIVSDISLYNQKKVEQGVREGTFYDLLADDIREGELLYRQRVSESVRQHSNYLTEAFEELIARKRAELGD